jgi:hypothetical protein
MEEGIATVLRPGPLSDAAAGGRRSALRRAAGLLLASVPVAFAAVVYFPITDNYFLGDDFPNLYLIEDGPILPYLLKPHGDHILLARNAVFFATAKLFGPQPAYFFWPVLLTHLLNAWLLFQVIERFTSSRLAACFGATLWATSPVHEEALGWYSVYGHVLVGTILLVILRRAAAVAGGGEPLSARVAWLWVGLALTAATCFGTGIAVAVALPAAAALWLGEPRRHLRRLAPLFLLPAAVPLLYAGLRAAYGALSAQPQPTAGIFLAALADWQLSLALLLHLVAYAAARLLLGFFPVAFPSPVSLAPVALFTASLVWVAWRSPAARRPLGACTLLLLAVYGVIAAGRARYIGDVPLAFFVAQRRYHYVGFLLVAVLVCIVLVDLAARVRLPAALKAAALLVWIGITAAAYGALRPPIDHHDEVRAAVGEVLASIRAQAEDAPAGQPVYVSNRYFDPVPPYLFRFEDFPGWAAVFVVFQPENTIDGRHVYFMQLRPNLRQKLKRGRRMAELIVPPRPGLFEAGEGAREIKELLMKGKRR